MSNRKRARSSSSSAGVPYSEGENLFASDMYKDYEENEALDNYDEDGIDDEEQLELDFAQKVKVDVELGKRDVLEGKSKPFLDENMDFEMVEHDVLMESIHDLKDQSIREWLAMDKPRNAIRNEIRTFLQGYSIQGSSVYGERIRLMCEMNLESLEVSYKHLEDANGILAYLVSNAPIEILKIFDEVAFEVVLMNFEQYEKIHSEIHVRITDIPVLLTLRELREVHLNTLVRVSGVVTRRTSVFPQLKYVKFDCVKCGHVIGPITQDLEETKLKSCPSCLSRGPFQLNMEQTVYRNYQKLTLQETPGTVPPGRLPRHREIVLLCDLIDSARPGDEIEVIGIYKHNFDQRLNTKQGFPVFSTILEANFILRRNDDSLKLTQEDYHLIQKLSQDPSCFKKIIKSIAPSIYGHEDIKIALALSLFGGVTKNVNNKHRIRGDVNILMLGDPGTAKSQFLKYVEKTAHRAVFTTGQGASAVGLTANVRKDPVSKEWTLEGGALVLADKGVCCIDEFDKMNDQDRTSIHEAMEQQSISISKAGIVTSLHARCSIIAAANPIRGRYMTQLPFSQNVNLTEPILSRFDVLIVVKDKSDPIMDEMLAEFVIQSHIQSHPHHTKNKMEDSVVPQDLLKKYILYAREKVHPKVQEMDEDKLAKLYSDLRRESLQTGSIPITVRHLESIIRMSEAHARMHLREYVRSDDIDMAISVTLDSFIQAQKYTVMRQLRKVFSKYVHKSKDNNDLLLYTLELMIRDHQVSVDEFRQKAQQMDIFNLESFYSSSLFMERFHILGRFINKGIRN